MGNDISKNVAGMIESEKVVIFSMTTCAQSKEIKELFRSLNAHYMSYELDWMDDGPDVLRHLGTLTGAETVPRVFVNGVFIGGAAETKALYDSGELKQLLQ